MTSLLENSPTSTDTLDISGLAPLHPQIPHVVMYTLPVCSNCDRLKMLFRAARLPVVAVPLAADTDAYRLLHDELQVKATPVVFVHNTFQEPVYFSGFDSERTSIVTAAVFGRLEILAESGQLASVDNYRADLAASIEPDARHPFIRPEVFASMAQAHLGRGDQQSVRIASPALLPASRSETPVLLR
jgi:hypothetical protein